MRLRMWSYDLAREQCPNRDHLFEIAAMVLTKTGLKALGRAMPLVAAPISAYLNNQHVQRVGDSAIRHYDGWVHAHEKSKKASGS